MEDMVTEGSAGINRFGKDVLNVIRKNKGGEFPTNVTDAEIKTALAEMNKDTSDATVRLAAKALEREGVRTSVDAGTDKGALESTRRADFLISGAENGLPITESLRMMRTGGSLPEGGKTKARETAEKMARKAGKAEGDKDWESTVSKFEKNQDESVHEQELKGTDGLVIALKAAIAAVKKTGSDADKKKVPEWEKLLGTFKKESVAGGNGKEQTLQELEAAQKVVERAQSVYPGYMSQLHLINSNLSALVGRIKSAP